MRSLVSMLVFLVLLMAAGIGLYLVKTRAARRAEPLPAMASALPVEDELSYALPSPNVASNLVEDVAAPALPISELRLPLQFYEDGSVKAELRAELAEVPDSGAIAAQQVRAQMYDTNGYVTGSIEAEACVYDRESKRAFSDSRIKFEQDQVTITGKGFEWRMEDETVRILDDVRVVSKRSLNTRWEFGR